MSFHLHQFTDQLLVKIFVFLIISVSTLPAFSLRVAFSKTLQNACSGSSHPPLKSCKTSNPSWHYHTTKLKAPSHSDFSFLPYQSCSSSLQQARFSVSFSSDHIRAHTASRPHTTTAWAATVVRGPDYYSQPDLSTV